MTSIESARVNIDTKLKYVEHLAKEANDYPKVLERLEQFQYSHYLYNRLLHILRLTFIPSLSNY